jgi:hypothetical protein
LFNDKNLNLLGKIDEQQEGLKKSESDKPLKEIERAPLESLFIDLKSVEENEAKVLSRGVSFTHAEKLEESISLKKKKSNNGTEYDDFNPLPQGENPMVEFLKKPFYKKNKIKFD